MTIVNPTTGDRTKLSEALTSFTHIPAHVAVGLHTAPEWFYRPR